MTVFVAHSALRGFVNATWRPIDKRWLLLAGAALLALALVWETLPPHFP